MRMPIAFTLLLSVQPLALSLSAPVLAAQAPKLPFETRQLAGSGSTLYAMQDARLPRVWYDLYLEAGERFVPAKFAGMTSLAARILERGPASTSYELYRRGLFRQGVEIDWEAGNRFLIAHVKCRPEQLGAITRLVHETAVDPRLDAATFSQLKDRVIGSRKAMDDDMRALTFHYTNQKLWNFHPNARRPEGWAETLGNIQRDDLKAFLAARLGHPGAFVSAVGPVAPAQVAAGLAPALKGWATGVSTGRSAAPTVAPVRRVILIDKPGSLDNQVYMLSPFAGTLDSREAAAAEVFLAGMGYGLGARLGKALRVERGLTYHASSGLRRAEWPSWYVYSFGANTKVAPIVSGVFELFDAAQGGLTDPEVTQAKDQLLKAQATEMETPPDQMRAVAAAVAQGLPASYPFQRPALLGGVTPAEVRSQAQILGGLSSATLVIMGDASKVQQPIAAALPQGTELTVTKLSDLAAEPQGQPVELHP